MQTRRGVLALTGGLLTSLSGCLANDGTADGSGTTPSDRPTESPSPAPAGTPTVAGTDEPDATRTEPRTTPDTVTRVTGELPAWRADRWFDVDYANVLGLDTDGSRLYVTMSDERGDSAVAALSPGRSRFDWETTLSGEAEGRSHHEPTNGTDSWGVTVGDDAVYSVNGRGESSEWTAVHALDAATGRKRWSFERERRLAVWGRLDDALVVAATEFFEPEHSHDTPEEPLATTVHALETGGGDERWSTAVTPLSALAVGADGVYTASNRTISGYSASGRARWETRVDGGVRLLTVVDDTLVAAVGPSDDSSSLVGLSTDGDVEWRVPLSTRWLLSVDDRVYVANDVVAAVTTDGTVAWQTPAHGHNPMISPDGGRLYTRTNTRMNAVDAYDLPGGERQFRFVTPSNNGWPLGATSDVVAAEAITPDKADFTSLFAVDAGTGEPQAVYRPSETVFTAQGLAGTLYVGFGDGKLGAFGTAS